MTGLGWGPNTNPSLSRARSSTTGTGSDTSGRNSSILSLGTSLVEVEVVVEVVEVVDVVGTGVVVGDVVVVVLGSVAGVV